MCHCSYSLLSRKNHDSISANNIICVCNYIPQSLHSTTLTEAHTEFTFWESIITFILYYLSSGVWLQEFELQVFDHTKLAHIMYITYANTHSTANDLYHRMLFMQLNICAMLSDVSNLFWFCSIPYSSTIVASFNMLFFCLSCLGWVLAVDSDLINLLHDICMSLWNPLVADAFVWMSVKDSVCQLMTDWAYRLVDNCLPLSHLQSLPRFSYSFCFNQWTSY